jgi:DNA primase
VIGQDTIERVRQQTGIVALIGETVKLQKRGRAHVGLCPFHKEKTPSFHVNEERGFYHCFGCGAHGDAFRFVMEVEGLAFVEAIRRLAERSGIQVVETASETEKKQHAEARRRQDELYSVGSAAAEFFERMMREHPLGRHAERELERRGLRTEDPVSPIADALQAFRVGYAPYSWDALGKHLRDSGFSHHAAEQVGLLVPRKTGSGHYDRFRHRLMFAVLDLQGRVIAFSGRALDDPSDEELRVSSIERIGSSTEPPAKYLNSPESPVYKKREAVFGLYQARQSVRDSGQCILVEGNFDVLSLHARGIKNAVAPLGTAFTLEQARQIKRFCPSVTLLFDADSAGRRAVVAAREAIKESGLVARVASLPNGKDPDDLVRESGAEALNRLLAAGRGHLEYLIDATLDGSFAADDARTRAEKVRELAQLIASEDDPTVRAGAEAYADRVAARLSGKLSDTDALGLGDVQKSFSALKSAVLRAVQQPAPAATVRHDPPDRARSRVSRNQVERTILGALLDYPELFGAEEVVAGVDLVEGDVAGALAALRQAWQQGDLQNPEVVLAKLSPSVHPFASARMAAPLHERIEDAQAEVLQNIEKLRRLGHKRRKSEVVEELERATKLGDLDQEVALLQEHMARARERHGL